LPIPSVRSRGFRALQSLLIRKPGRLMACLLPVRPGASPDPRVFSPRTSRRVVTLFSVLLSCASTPPQRLSLTSAAFLPASHVDRDPRSKSPSRKLFRPSAFPDPETLLRTLLLEERPGDFAPSPESPAPRVWLPSRRCEAPEPLRTSFSPQRSWASPFRAFLLHSGPQEVSLQGFRSCAPLHNLRGLASALQRLSHHESRAPSCCPKG
jgi:hypothetical protein